MFNEDFYLLHTDECEVNRGFSHCETDTKYVLLVVPCKLLPMPKPLLLEVLPVVRNLSG